MKLSHECIDFHLKTLHVDAFQRKKSVELLLKLLMFKIQPEQGLETMLDPRSDKTDPKNSGILLGQVRTKLTSQQAEVGARFG
jgi:hypothetical protein